MALQQTDRVTQATELSRSAFGLTPHELPLATIRLLEDRETLILWLDQVKAELNRLNLQALIDAELPLPGPHEPGYQWWQQLAGHVKDWLSAHMSQAIHHSPRWATCILRSPVDYLSTVCDIVNHPDARLSGEAWKKALDFTQYRHSSLNEYVAGLKKAVAASELAGMPITPYQATCILFSGLQGWGAEGKAYSVRRFSELPLNIAREMTLQDFFAICDEALNLAY